MCRVLFSPPSESFFSLTVFFSLRLPEEKKKKKRKRKKQPSQPHASPPFPFFFSGKKKKKETKISSPPAVTPCPSPSSGSACTPFTISGAPLLSLSLAPLLVPSTLCFGIGPLSSALGWGLSPDVCHKLKRVFKLWQQKLFSPLSLADFDDSCFLCFFPLFFLFSSFIVSFLSFSPSLSKVRLT